LREKMILGDPNDARLIRWLSALEDRHLANLTPSEVARALRALSSCYVERRARLAEGAPLGTAGKRAAFALFYAPLHLLIVRRIVQGLAIAADRVKTIHDLGCGTGAAGAAWALESQRARVSGIDRNPWAVAEANWTYRELGLEGRAAQRDVARTRLHPTPHTGIVAGYVVNELSEGARGALLQQILDAHGRGAAVLVLEPIARGVTPWWPGWEHAFVQAGGRADEWRFPAELPRRQRDLARAAGLRPQEFTARTLFAG
jgi:hypothetical protein